MSAGEILRNHPDTFWLIHNCGRLAEQNARRAAAKRKKSVPVVEVKILDTKNAVAVQSITEPGSPVALHKH